MPPIPPPPSPPATFQVEPGVGVLVNGELLLNGVPIGSGGVTSVSFTAPVQFSVLGSPVTASGTIALSWVNENVNLVLAGPSSGSAAAPTFRPLVSADIPSSVALAGNPTTTTQAPGDNSIRIATTAFVTNALAGIDPAIAVQAATTAASDTSGLTYSNGVSGVGATFTGTINTAVTIDGYTFSALGQRLLVKNDTQSPSGAFNGIYYVTQLQTALLAPILTRALDYDQPSNINNTGAIPVINGTVNGTTLWVLTSQVNTVGTDPLTYADFSGTTLSPANPTATAGPSAVNGSATTYMRSDAAPAIQLGSASQFGIVKVDGSTITASGGVISASGGGGGSNGVWSSIANTFVQSKTTATTAAINTTGAKLIAAFAACSSGSPPNPYTVTDSNSNTYIARTAYTGSSSTQGQFFYCVNPTVGASHTFTLTGNGSAPGNDPFTTFLVWAFSWSGTTITYISETGAGSAGNVSTLYGGAMNPAAIASYLAVTGLCAPQSATVNNLVDLGWNPFIGAGFSSGNYNGGWMCWKITACTEAPEWSWNSNTGAVVVGALFKGS